MVKSDDLEEGELEEIRAGEREIKEGKYRRWEDIKKEI